MKKKSVEKNYIYNLIYQLFLLIVPLAVTPYVSRILEETGIGQYSFTYSISTYFTLFASMGFGYYAQRLIASHQGDEVKQTYDFFEILIARLIPCILSLLIYFLLIWCGVYEDKYELLMYIMSLNVIAVIFDITFLFQGNEEFGKIVLRNVIIKSISIACIFIFVKSKSDLWIYTLIQCGNILLCNISLWLFLPKLLKKIEVKNLKPLKHLVPSLILFLPTIATSIYTSLDKTLIGLITKEDSENGNYEYAESLVKMTMTIVTSLGTVMIPRNAKKFADKDYDGLKQNVMYSCRFVFFLGIPLMFGIAAISNNLIPWYLGDGYDKVSNLIKIFSPIIVIIGFSNVFGLQLLVPCGQDKKFTLAIICGAVTNFLLNLLLIYYFKSYGAALATLIAESVVTTIMFVYCRKFIDFKSLLKMSWKYLLSGVLMFVPCYFLGDYLSSSILHTVLVVLLGAVIYFICLLITREETTLTYLKKIFNKLKRSN